MNFIYVIHLMCWNYLIDMITHSRNRNNSIHCNNKGARARSARAPLLSPSPLLFLFLLCVIMSILAIRWFQHIRWMT